ncbi:DUF1365 domain-containing protein [Variovorax sp. J22R24]|uniref:DUF1365 domain-containing protein n=1 Tax=Variovorax gracilis TaxID=3053502 RepID=UPI002578649B|nr:DUF1365 domain-containing protein [Variovorax sp. J22R24]MDM0106185.1 DUF1365 domain-containing protein [Variovorax sp. J22R24]
MSSRSALYAGSVMHRRSGPARHRLRYRMFSLLIDLDELPQLGRELRLFSFNRFNLFSLHERDYGDGRGLRAHVERQLAAASLAAGGSIRLLSMPRILGYAFNPLSVYFCERPDGGVQAILYEVNNTFGERHSYLIPVDASERHAERIEQRCAKEFHVSPFLAMEMAYRFRVEPPGSERKGLHIGVDAEGPEGVVLTACFDARRRALSDAALLLAFFSHPLLTIKVMGAIHWEALRLWFKGARLHRHPAAPARAVTIVGPTKR